MKGDPEFVILKYQAWMDATEFEDLMLGAIIREPLSPTTNFVPSGPRDLRPDVQTGSATDFILNNSGESMAAGAASLSSITGFSINGSRNDSTHLAGKLIRYKRIRQLDQYWAKLIEDQDVKSTVPGWISLFNPYPVCLVVGIMVCEEVDLSKEDSRSREVKANVEIPVSQAVMAPGLGDGVNPVAEMSAAKKNTNTFQAHQGKGSIFAIELRKVTTAFINRKQLKLRQSGPDIDETRLAGEDTDDDDEDEAVSSEDIILDELTPEEYEDMTVS